MTSAVGIRRATARCALGATEAALNAAFGSGASALAPVQGFDASGFAARRGVEAVLAAQLWTEDDLAEDDPALRILGPHGRILEQVIREVHDGEDLAAVSRDRIGLYVGLGMVDSREADLAPAAAAARGADGALDLARFFKSAYRLVHPLWPLSMLNNVALGQIATDLDIRGDNLVFASDAAGGMRALLEARQAIAEDVVDVAIAGGVSERVCPASLARRALAGETVPPGEGGAAVLLQRGTAGADAVLCGGVTVFGTNEEATVKRAIHKALAAADRTHVDVVLQHGLGPSPDLPADAIDHTPSIGDLGAGHPAFLLARTLPLLRQPDVNRILLLSGSAGGAVGALVVEAV